MKLAPLEVTPTTSCYQMPVVRREDNRVKPSSSRQIGPLEAACLSHQRSPLQPVLIFMAQQAAIITTLIVLDTKEQPKIASPHQLIGESLSKFPKIIILVLPLLVNIQEKR